METAHSTDTVQGVPTEGEDVKFARTNSKQNSKAARGQALMAQKVAAKSGSGSAGPGSHFPNAVAIDLDVDESELDAAERDAAESYIPEAYATEVDPLEQLEMGETISCVTFDASPDDAAADAAVKQPPPAASIAANAADASFAANASNAGNTAGAATDLSGMIEAGDNVSRKDLVALLEGFVRIIKTDDAPTVAPLNPVVGTGLQVARERTVVTTSEANVDDRTVEIDQMRGLVIEAQDTIIKLLTDRVDDRSRIATLEAQLALIPDLQAQADRAMSVAVRTEEYRTELNKMKFELDRFRLFRVRIEAEHRKTTVFNRIQKWLFSRPNAKDETLQNSN